MSKKKSTSSFLNYILIGCLIVMCLKIYFNSEVYNLKCIIADENGKKYCIRDRYKIKEAANLLASAVDNCTKLVEYTKNKYPQREDIKRLVEGFNPNNISETLPNSELTAYSENKGEKLAFCLNRTKNSNNKLIDLNTLTFVAIHELAHIMTISVGHKQEFWNNFKFLLENAEKAGLYNPVDYKNDPQSYCGITITDNPYYDV